MGLNLDQGHGSWNLDQGHGSWNLDQAQFASHHQVNLQAMGGVHQMLCTACQNKMPNQGSVQHLLHMCRPTRCWEAGMVGRELTLVAHEQQSTQSQHTNHQQIGRERQEMPGWAQKPSNRNTMATQACHKGNCH